MASIRALAERRFKITVCNGYHQDGKKICKSRTICVPKTVRKRGIHQYVAHEAEEFERTFRYGYSEDAAMTYEQYAQSWLGRQQHYRASTLAGHRAMQKVCWEYIGGIPLEKLRPLTIEHFLEQLRTRPSRGGVMSEATVQKYLSSVSVVLADAKRNELIPHNPAQMVSLPRVDKVEQAIPTEQEMKKFVMVLRFEPLVYRVYFMLALLTGARRGELCALTWADVNRNTITISKSRGHVQGRGLVTGPTKNGRTRYVGNTVEMMWLLNALRQAYRKAGLVVTDGMELFLNDRGRPIDPDTFTRRIRKIYDLSGLSKRYHLHTLRHYAATHWLQANVSKQVVAEILGHGDTGFLERTYCHPQMECKAQAAQTAMQQLLPPDMQGYFGA